MTTVQDATDNETTRTKQGAALSLGSQLCELGLPVAFISVGDFTGILRILLSGYGAATVTRVRADFDQWVNALGVDQFTETDTGNELTLKADVTYEGVEVKVTASVHCIERDEDTKTRTVTR